MQKRIPLILCMLLATISGCDDFFSKDISAETMVVNSPSDSLFVQHETVSFWWEENADVEQFALRITQGGSSNIMLVLDTLLAGNTVLVDFEEDAAYEWQLRGENTGSNTPWVKGWILVDGTNPEKATALHLDGDTIGTGLTDTLAWTSIDLPIDGVRYPVVDSLILYRRNDSATVGQVIGYGLGQARKLAVNASSPNTMNGPGRYHWRVVTIDQSGNRKVSDQFSFIVE